MRFIAVVLLALGLALVAKPFIPAPALAALPLHWASGVVLAAVGLLLLVVRPGRMPSTPRDLVAEQLGRGFVFTDEAHGWRARGAWDGRPIEVRCVRGYEASRFGLERVVEVSVRGRPTTPWPLAPDQARLVDQRDHGVCVAMPAASRPGAERGIPAAITAVLAEVQPEGQR